MKLAIIAGLSLLCISLAFALARIVRAVVDKFVRWQRHQDDRLSSLEVKETVQDERLDQHDQRFHEDERAVRMLSKEVGELGKDVGWEDDQRKTEVLKLPINDDNDPV